MTLTQSKPQTQTQSQTRPPTNTEGAVQPYLFFDGRCEEGLDFYREALGAHVETVMRFKESHNPMPPGVLQPAASK